MKIGVNVLYLSLVNIINYALPLILIPYLINHFGLELFGKYVMTQAVLAIGLMVVNFGFDFSAVKLTSVHRGNPLLLASLLRNVALSKLLLFIIVSLLFALIVTVGGGDRDVIRLTMVSLLYVLFFGLIPNWFYQGIEEMKYLALITGLQKFLFFTACFLFINGQGDFLKVGYFLVLSSLIALIVSYFTLRHIFKSFEFCDEVDVSEVEKLNVWCLLKQSWHLFLSTFFMSSYREMNVLLIKLFVTFEVVAVYSVAEKIIKGIQGVISPVTRALFPYFSRVIVEDGGRRKFESFLGVYALGLLIVVTIFYLSAGFVAALFLTSASLESQGLLVFFLRVMSLVIFVGGINYSLGIIGLVNLGKEKLFTLSVLLSGGFSILLLMITSQYNPTLAGPIAFVGAEVLLFLLLVRFYYWERRN